MSGPRGDFWASIDWAIGVLLGAAIGAVVPLLFLHKRIAADEVAAATGILAAVATFSAVWVALLPIWRGEERRVAAAQAVRMTALVPLSVIGSYLSMTSHRGTPLPQVLGYEPAQKAIERLWALLPRTEVLEASEQQALATAVGSWETVANAEAAGTGTPTLATIQWLLGVVVTAYDRMALPLGSRPFNDLPGIQALHADAAAARAARESAPTPIPDR